MSQASGVLPAWWMRQTLSQPPAQPPRPLPVLSASARHRHPRSFRLMATRSFPARLPPADSSSPALSPQAPTPPPSCHTPPPPLSLYRAPPTSARHQPPTSPFQIFPQPCSLPTAAASRQAPQYPLLSRSRALHLASR